MYRYRAGVPWRGLPERFGDFQIDTLLDANAWTALCDAHQLENALLNLAINARDAMPDRGCVEIRMAKVGGTASSTEWQMTHKQPAYVIPRKKLLTDK